MSGDKMVIFFTETDHPTGRGMGAGGLGDGGAMRPRRRETAASRWSFGVYAAKTIKGLFCSVYGNFLR